MCDAKNWVVGPKLGDSSSIFLKNLEVATSIVPSFDWKYHDKKADTYDPWIVDDALIGKPLKGKLSQKMSYFYD